MHSPRMPRSLPTRAARPAARAAERGPIERPGPAGEHDREDAEDDGERDREAGMQELVGARVPRPHDRDRQGQGREHPEHDGPRRSCVAPHDFR